MGGVVPAPQELCEDGTAISLHAGSVRYAGACSPRPPHTHTLSIVFAFYKAPYLRERAPVALEMDRAALKPSSAPASICSLGQGT